MKFLIDAHLPPSLAELLKSAGHDAIHTRDLPSGNRTSDSEVNRISMVERRVVITKDVDFVNSLLLHNEPYKLLLISTGNITNQQLFDLFARNLPQIVEAFEDHTYLELERNFLNLHR
jgi:predicted nuclease of predicted toxin-antitoxin system